MNIAIQLTLMFSAEFLQLIGIIFNMEDTTILILTENDFISTL